MTKQNQVILFLLSTKKLIFMKQYLDLLSDIMEHGIDKSDRTGTGTRSVFGRQLRFDLTKGFPLLTTKKLYTRAIIHELLWFIKGDTNIKYLHDNNVTIWDEWADENGDLGPVYGAQWRNWNGEGIDQLKDLVNQLKHNPDSRRMIVTAWNPSQLGQMQLPPCHMMYQCYVAEGRLSLMLYQRSCDSFLGVPFNIASYALFTAMLAQVCGYKPKEFVHTIGDAHIYKDHFDVVKEQISRTPYPKCQLVLNPEVKSIFDFTIDDIKIENYQSHGRLVGKVSV